MNEEKKLIVYQTDDGAIALKADAEQETVWATQQQLAEVLAVNVPAINEHIKNIFQTSELEEKPTIRKFRIVQKEGKREVARNIDHYNLDMMLPKLIQLEQKKENKYWDGEFQEVEQKNENTLNAVALSRVVRNA